MEKLTKQEFLQKVAQLIKDVMEYEPVDQLNHIVFLRFAMKDLFYYHDNLQADSCDVFTYNANHDTKDWLCCLLVTVGEPDKYMEWLKEGTTILDRIKVFEHVN